ncbi:MAG: CHAT domain-containing protein, partial [Planctomycetes bacterium]|nr:CHAT domain-containing protein [Planctomycetota bacterium]
LYLSLPITLRTQGSAIYPTILTWKGATAARQWRDRQCASADTAPLDVELQQIRRRLATLTLHVPEPAERREWMGQIFKLTMRKEALEQQRAVYSAKLQGIEPEVGIADVQKVLPPGLALIDFLQYTHTSFAKVNSPKAPGAVEMQQTQRLLAFVVRRDRSTTRIDLGEFAPIREAITKWRKTRGFRPDPGKTDWAAKTGQLLWPHLKPWVNDCDTLLISPDGVLSQLAWNVLPGRAPDRYLIEDFAIATVPTPQLLPALLSSAEPIQKLGMKQTLLLLGDIDYNAPPAPPAVTPASAKASPLPRPAVAASFTPLKGTAAEVRAIEDQFHRQSPTGLVTMLAQGAATEEAFWREAARHRWLHVATHGFFAPPNIKSALATQNQMDPEAMKREGVSLFHVDYLNGLALAGANIGATGDGDDGILTAAELSVMDLRNVDTVVLSGCETGLGEASGGEGTFGMQRALQIAGVHTTVGSLWTVSDEKTNLLMQRFYNNLWEKKLPRLQALREAQLWMLNSGTAGQQRLSPHYWAAFTLSGDWR